MNFDEGGSAESHVSLEAVKLKTLILKFGEMVEVPLRLGTTQQKIYGNIYIYIYIHDMTVT